jgi:DNA-binding response OmpR family regulator
MLEANVLIVEDEMLIAWQVRDLLEDFGFHSVQTAGKFADALAVAERQSPKLLICDINLGSGLDGIATASAIASHRTVHVIFVTGYAGSQIRTRVEKFDPGAKLLRKPIQEAFLRNAIMEVLSETSN